MNTQTMKTSNTTNTSTAQYKDFSEFIAEHSAKKLDKEMTHTRIASQELNIYGGNYHIEPEELETFHRLYYEHVFVKGRKEYLTEKQLQNGTGPILIDFDFRYEYSVAERVHTQEHVQDIIQLYLEELKELLVFEDNVPFPIFVMEKPNVNRVADKQLTKDGIHIIIGIQMDHVLQMILRDKILEKIGDIWELPLTNDWPTVLDEGISKGIINWQLYGSQKPGNEAYRITYYLTASFNSEDNDFVTTAKAVKDLDLSRDFKKVSAQYDKNVRFQINPKIMAEYTSKMEQRDKPRPKKASGSKGKINIVLSEEDEIDVNISPEDVKDEATLKKVVDAIMQQLRTNEQFIRETHEYTQVLPEKYYQPGSHALNRQVAFALKRTDDRLFYSWVMLRSKASDFDYGSIPSLFNEWQHHFNKKGNSEGVTRRSIMYWAKQDAFEAYEKVKKSTIDNYIEETIYEAGDWDYAMVLYHMYKDKYVCSSITNKKWYTFKNNRWEKDEGQTLRMAISKDLFQLYSDKQNEYVADMQIAKENEDQHEKIQRKIKKISEVGIKLKKTNDKNNIMREAMEIFFDKEFIRNMDANPYLMCFSNGVVDFKNKTFRQGYPQDYITKTTGIPYVPFNPEANNTISEEIIVFMEQLFPQPDLCRYMWDHLASTLIGIKKEHAFNIYRGSGSNGKSILTDLMSQSLGDYKGTVPITLVTEKRNTIGGTSSEVIQLKGIRYAVMQEPSKDAVINEGIMKELTGGDPIQARALYSESEIFIPQFSLVVCTNALFEVRGGDDGTWRRMKLVDFVSKFISEGEHHTDDTKHVFPKDKSLKEKLPSWAIVFISMLVKRAFETDGEVLDCSEVKAASNKYRQSQDCIAGFIADKIEKEQGKTVGKKLLNDVFKEWFQMNYGNRKAPKLMELEEAMNKRFETKTEGKGDTRKWINIRIKSDIDEQDDDIIQGGY
jgi:P4 family phage/plasmid primase-like protien